MRIPVIEMSSYTKCRCRISYFDVDVVSVVGASRSHDRRHSDVMTIVSGDDDGSFTSEPRRTPRLRGVASVASDLLASSTLIRSFQLRALID